MKTVIICSICALLLNSCTWHNPGKKISSISNEKKVAREIYSGEKLEKYMKYYRQGYSDQIRAGKNCMSIMIMIEGGWNQWLEQAHRKGQEQARVDNGWDIKSQWKKIYNQ